MEQLHQDLEALLETVREEDRLAAEAAAEEETTIEDAETVSEQTQSLDAGASVEIDTAQVPLYGTETQPSEPDLPLVERDTPLATRMVETGETNAPELDLGIVDQPEIILDRDSFHAQGYKPTLQQLARLYVREEAPITFKRLSDLIARDHGFQRTGGKISSTIWHAVERVAPRTRSADEHWIFWPEATQPDDVLPFRGLEINGRPRQWREVPLPEKLGLIRQTTDEQPADLAEAVAGILGYGRVTKSFRTDIAKLAALLGQGEANPEDLGKG